MNYLRVNSSYVMLHVCNLSNCILTRCELIISDKVCLDKNILLLCSLYKWYIFVQSAHVANQRDYCHAGFVAWRILIIWAGIVQVGGSGNLIHKQKKEPCIY